MTVVPDFWKDNPDDLALDLGSNLCVTDFVSQDEAILDDGSKSSNKVSVVSADNAEASSADCIGALEPANTDGLLPGILKNTEYGGCSYPCPPT